MAEGGLPDLGAKLGPLPAWQWAIGAVGGFLLWRHFHPASSAPPAVTVPSATAADAALAGTVVPDTSGGLGGVGGTSPAAAPVTNAEWVNAGVRALIGQHADPLAAENALNKYVAGLPLTTAEHALVSEAITAIGPPPEGVPISTPAPPGPGPGSPPPPPGSGGHVVPLPPGTFKIPGEYVVGFVVPQDGRGTWYLSNYGGIAAIGGARYLGSPIARGVHAPIPPAAPSWRWSGLHAYGRYGYQAVSTRGDVQAFGG